MSFIFTLCCVFIYATEGAANELREVSQFDRELEIKKLLKNRYTKYYNLRRGYNLQETFWGVVTNITANAFDYDAKE